MTAATLEPMTAKTAAAEKNQATTIAYILGSGHSGSTLLAMLLGVQPEACTVGEMRVPSVDGEQYLCSCGEPIRKCGFWKQVGEGMAKRGIPNFDITDAGMSIHDVDSAYAHRLLKPLPRGAVLETARSLALGFSPAWQNHLRNVHHRNKALVEVLREITGAKVVIDSSKIALHLKYLLQSPDLNIKVIYLVRDGRAVTTSMLGHNFNCGTREQTIAGAALSWRKNNESAERVLADLPKSQWVHLQYEELCRRPLETVRSLCEFLGMDTSNIVMDFRARQQHILGNEMRMKSGSDIRLDERWRKALSKEDLDIFESVAGEANRKYGYE